MKSDYQEWAEFSEQASLLLQRKIIGAKPLFQLVVKASSDKEYRLDLSLSGQRNLRVDVLEWKKSLDRQRLNDPLEKIKLLGRHNPTIQHTSLSLSECESTNILYLLEHLSCQIHEYKIPKKQPRPAKARFTLKLFVNNKNIETQWNSFPETWNIIPELCEMLTNIITRELVIH